MEQSGCSLLISVNPSEHLSNHPSLHASLCLPHWRIIFDVNLNKGNVAKALKTSSYLQQLRADRSYKLRPDLIELHHPDQAGPRLK